MYREGYESGSEASVASEPTVVQILQRPSPNFRS